MTFSGQTIEQRIQERGYTSGFDYLRIILAMAVVAWHSSIFSTGSKMFDQIWNSPSRPFEFVVLPMFFTLSGFLVSGSLQRTKRIYEFVMLRVLRIFPALFLEILLSAFILGPLLTSVTLQEYFSSAEFYSYFLNVLGDVHYLLPGVFEHTPDPRLVNAQLWTIPWELRCYVSIVVLSIIGVVRSRVFFLFVCVLANIGTWITYIYHYNTSNAASGPMLVLFFLSGVCFFLWREKIILNKYVFIFSIVITYIFTVDPRFEYFSVVPIVYITIYLGMLSPPKKWLFGGADLSYGLYLFGFPLQQTCAQLFPNYLHWWFNLGFALMFGLLYAAFSWNVVEKRVMLHRKAIIERVELAFRGLMGLVRRKTITAPNSEA